MRKTIILKLPVAITILISLLVMVAVEGVFIWKEHQNNTNLAAGVNQQTKADNKDYAMYREVARRLADLQRHIGSPEKISYDLPYSNNIYNGDQYSTYMSPLQYRESYDGVDNCANGPGTTDFLIKSCKDYADSVFRAWNP